ncbi:hypothetical protein ACFV8E_30705 [Streptomyces sp. NPDC059849]|uniref:hypothetical protein n=1 Tax=Streptomyces sp. NPDC059849 TaxID=3346969 RepID=UPI0036649EFC
MKSPRWISWVLVSSPKASHASFVIGSAVAVRVSKQSLGELTFAIASKMPHWRNRCIVAGRRPIPAPTSRTWRACS